MNNDYKSSVFKDLLDKLQQESWQLELLISGFAIFGLFSSLPSIDTYLAVANYNDRVYGVLLWFALKVCCWILISNLLVHVVLRGLWIGTLGLRDVSGDIDNNELKYSPKFTNFLKKKIGSFDKYIGTLENYCSVLFAISFLLIFYFLACIAFLVAILLVVFLVLDPETSNASFNTAKNIFGGIFILFLILGMFLTFLDFITQGFLKKKKWISFIYFPLYRFYSVVTLSFLYRPLVYNFLDNKFGKRLSFILVPVYLTILFFFSYHYKDSNYINPAQSSSVNFANSHNYEDLLVKDTDFMKVATIQSKVITDSYIKVFMDFNENLENRIFTFNKGLKPKVDNRGLQSNIKINGNNFTVTRIRKKDSLTKVYYNTLNNIHQVLIDGKLYNSEFVASTNTNEKLGFEAYINIKDLKEGKHLLKINRKRIRKKDTLYSKIVEIPFWHFKN